MYKKKMYGFEAFFFYSFFLFTLGECHVPYLCIYEYMNLNTCILYIMRILHVCTLLVGYKFM